MQASCRTGLSHNHFMLNSQHHSTTAGTRLAHHTFSFVQRWCKAVFIRLHKQAQSRREIQPLPTSLNTVAAAAGWLKYEERTGGFDLYKKTIDYPQTGCNKEQRTG